MQFVIYKYDKRWKILQGKQLAASVILPLALAGCLVTTAVRFNKMGQEKEELYYFSVSDTLSSIADGRIINATKVNDYEPYKSVFLSDDLRLTELDEVFTSGIYCTEEHALVGRDKSELVHNNGKQHVYKATSEGTELIKTSKYPMYVTEDGYIAYYSSRSHSSVTVNIQSPGGDIVSSTTIDGYSVPVGWAYGGVVDRLSISDSAFSFADTKGAPFSDHLYSEQVRNAVTGYYDTKYVQYLFYKNGKVVLDEVF